MAKGLTPPKRKRPTLAKYMARVEHDYLVRALARCGNHMGNTALELGISRKNLWEKIRKLGIDTEPGEDDGCPGTNSTSSVSR